MTVCKGTPLWTYLARLLRLMLTEPKLLLHSAGSVRHLRDKETLLIGMQLMLTLPPFFLNSDNRNMVLQVNNKKGLRSKQEGSNRRKDYLISFDKCFKAIGLDCFF